MSSRWGSDLKVREWMKDHKEETAIVQAKYDELRALSIEELLEMAPGDVRAKVKDKLIVGIIKKGA